MNKKITVTDILISTLLMLAIAAFIVLNFAMKEGKNLVLIIESPGAKYYYNLDQKKTVDISGANGLTKIEIDNGKFRFVESACINKICVNTGWININNFPVVCLPNRVSAYIKNDEKKDLIDGILR